MYRDVIAAMEVILNYMCLSCIYIYNICKEYIMNNYIYVNIVVYWLFVWLLLYKSVVLMCFRYI